MTDEVSFRLLGPLEIWRSGRQIAISAPRKLTVLAALLLQANHTVSTAQLIAAVWHERPPATAVNQIAICIAALRRALAPQSGMIATRPSGYQLNAPPGALDLERVEALVGRGRSRRREGRIADAAADLREALTNWRGPVLCGITSAALQPHVAAWEERRLAVAEEAFALDLQLGRHDTIVAELAAFVATHPLRERPRGLLMVALYQSGRQAEALVVFRDTRRMLDEELGLQPSTELQELERSILVQDPRLLRPTRHRTPRARARLQSNPQGRGATRPGR